MPNQQSQNLSQNISLSINYIDLQVDEKVMNKSIKGIFSNRTSQFDQHCLNNIRNGQQNQKENQEILNKRIKKFYHYKVKYDADQYFRPRIEPVYEQKKYKLGSQSQIAEEEKVYPVQDQIILYGTDFISIKNLKKVYKPSQCKLVDQSHVRLKYDSYEELLDALIKNSRQNVFENQTKLQAGKRREIPRKWIQLNPYYHNNEQRRLIARFLTNIEKQNLKVTLNKKNYLYDRARQIYLTKKKEKQQIQQRHEERYFQRRGNRNYNGDQNMSYDNYQKRERSRDRNGSIIMNDGHGRFAKTLLKPSMDQISLSNISYKGDVKENQEEAESSVSGDLSYILRDINEDDESLTAGQLIHQLHNLQIQNDANRNSTSSNNRDNDQQLPISQSQSQSNRSINLSYSLSQNMPGPQPQSSFLKKSQKSGISKVFSYKKYVQETQNQQKRKKIQVIDLCDNDD